MPPLNYGDEETNVFFRKEREREKDSFRPHPVSIFDRVERPIDISVQARPVETRNFGSDNRIQLPTLQAKWSSRRNVAFRFVVNKHKPLNAVYIEA